MALTTLITLCLTVTFLGVVVGVNGNFLREERGIERDRGHGRGLLGGLLGGGGGLVGGLVGGGLLGGGGGLGGLGGTSGILNKERLTNFHTFGGAAGYPVTKAYLQRKLMELEAATRRINDLLSALEQEEAEARGKDGPEPAKPENTPERPVK